MSGSAVFYGNSLFGKTFGFQPFFMVCVLYLNPDGVSRFLSLLPSFCYAPSDRYQEEQSVGLCFRACFFRCGEDMVVFGSFLSKKLDFFSVQCYTVYK